MNKEERKVRRFWLRTYVVLWVAAIMLAGLCSCEDLVTADGVVRTVEKCDDYRGYKFKVEVEKSTGMAVIQGGNTYWFLTNDTLLVGDVVHIGKVK